MSEARKGAGRSGPGTALAERGGAARAQRAVLRRALAGWIEDRRVRAVWFAGRGVAPPPLAYVTSFPRLSLALSGRHPMELARDGGRRRIAPRAGDAVFVPANAWNRPEWTAPVEVLTFLFGKRHAGLSLVVHDGRSVEPKTACKAPLEGTHEGVVKHLVESLTARATEPPDPALDRHLVEALLRASLALLDRPARVHVRKAQRTYEALCLYVQESFQTPLTRESVARHFGLSPNHVSRLFRQEGSMRFSDYVTRVRIDRAKLLLREYDGTLKEVAASCGYPDVAYFCRVFRKMTRLTPTRYRAGAS